MKKGVLEQRAELSVEPGRLMHSSEGFFRLMAVLGKEVNNWPTCPKKDFWLLLPDEELKQEETAAHIQKVITSISGICTSYVGISPIGSPDDSSPYFNPSVRRYAPLNIVPDSPILKEPMGWIVNPKMVLTAVFRKTKIQELGLSRKKEERLPLCVPEQSEEGYAQLQFNSCRKYHPKENCGVGLPTDKIFDFNRIEAFIGYSPQFTDQIRNTIHNTGLNIPLYIAESTPRDVPFKFKRAD